MSTMREQFEAAAKQKGFFTNRVGPECDYTYADVRAAWWAWQAATEAAKATGTAVHKLCETFGIKIPEGMTPEMAIACRLKDLEDAVAQVARQPAQVLNDLQVLASIKTRVTNFATAGAILVKDVQRIIDEEISAATNRSQS